jgi:four helix bundle protein
MAPWKGTYQDLKVWQASVELAIEVYRITREFPKSEQYGLTSQLRRAAVAVSSLIAEGWGRGSRAELANRCCLSRGELKEVESNLIIAERLDYVARAALAPVRARIVLISRMLTALRRRLR